MTSNITNSDFNPCFFGMLVLLVPHEKRKRRRLATPALFSNQDQAARRGPGYAWIHKRGVGYEYESIKTVEEKVAGENGELTLVKQVTTTQTQHIPGDVGAPKSWLTNL